MDENELRVLLEKEDTVYEDEDEDLNGNEQGILYGILEDFETHSGSGRLVSNYKVLLRILEDPSKVKSDILILTLKAICEGINVAHGEVTAAGGDITKLNREQWKTARKSTITLLFIFYKAVTNIESKFFAEQHNLSVVAAVQATRRKPKKNTVSDNSNYPFWEQYRQRLLVQMNRLLKCPLEKIWPSEANFFRGVTLAVCTVIANPAAKLARNSELVDNLFDVLGQLCSRYEEESGVINRLIPMIKNSEDTAKVIAYGLNRLHSEYDRSRVLFNAVKEVLQLFNNQLERETPAERSVAVFLHEMSVLCPKGTVAALPFIIQFLESESSSIRGAVLSVAAELLKWSKVPDANPDAPAAQNDEENDIDMDTLRDDVLHYLILHSRDTNALVRNKVLQLCTTLISDGSLYLPEILLCAELAKARLLDKATTTRKYAINLLSAAVYCDPIVIKFSAAAFKKQIRDLREELMNFLGQNLPIERKIKAVVKEFVALVKIDDLSDQKLPSDVDTPEAALNHIETLLKDGAIFEGCKFLYLALQEFVQHPDFKPFEKEMKSQKMYLKMFMKLLKLNLDDSDAENTEGEIEDAGVVESDHCKSKRHYITYIENCHVLATVMEAALPSMTILLELGTSGDKAEVIEYLAILTESGYILDERVTGGIIEAVAQMDAASRTELIDSVWRIFLKGCDTESSVISRLFEIMKKLSSSQRERLGILIQEMVKNQSLSQEHFQILWDAFGLTNPNWKPEDSKYAAYILGIVGRSHRSVITANINYLIDVGLGPRGLKDLCLAQNTCEALMLLCPKASKNVDEETEDLQTTAIRFPSDHELYEKLSNIIINGISQLSVASTDHSFQKTSELIMQLIYRTCLEPKKIVLQLLNNILDIIFGGRKEQSEIKHTERILCRYLSIVTALLGAHVFYYENVVLLEVKRRKKQMASKGKSTSKKAPKANKSVARSRNNTAASNMTVNGSTLQSSNVNATADATEVNEMDVIIGNIGYDAELEAVRGYLEKILNETGTFKQMRTHTLFVCSRLETYRSLQLKIAAVRALSKIMSMSSMSVARNAHIFMGLWANASNHEVKCELIRAAILLNVRYPNQMENCNQSLLLGLQDEKDCIKMAALDFITFLALNDLVKIRDQLTEVAVCLIDANPDVQEMAKDFLEQCGEKDNMLSNALPDILSRLSSREMDQDSYQQIMKFLLEKVKKDRLLQGFVEKLILRFRVATKGRQCQDVAFCLNQLSYNDKLFKIIQENFNSYQDKLGDEYVFDAFNTIAANLRKTAKPEFKLKLDDFEKELVVARAKCAEKDRMEEAAIRKAVIGAPPDSSSSDSEPDEPNGENVEEPEAGTSDKEENESDNEKLDDNDHEKDDDAVGDGESEQESEHESGKKHPKDEVFSSDEDD